MKPILVNVQTYADFDIPVTNCVMIAPAEMSREDAVHIVNGIFAANQNTDDPSNAIKQLKRVGFTTCKTIDLTVGGNL